MELRSFWRRNELIGELTFARHFVSSAKRRGREWLMVDGRSLM